MSKLSDKEAEKIITFGTPTLNDWKIYLRNLQQNPSIQNMATPDSSSSESSFELEESFKALLDRKRREMQEKRCDERTLGEDSDVVSREATKSGNDSTFIEQDSISKISDTSFEEMERICAVLDKVNGFDTSVKMKEDTVKPPAPTLQQSVTLGDLTQLEDIDEPSGLWENTILPALSPVKRMHMLRPSTILEETTMSGPAEASKNSSIETYISARQVADSVNINSATSGSDVYRTAQDTFETDSYACSSILDMDSGLTTDLTGAANRSNNDHPEDEYGYSKNTTREADSLEEVPNVIILDSSDSDIEEEAQVKEHKEEEHETLGSTFPLDSIACERDESLSEHEQTSLVYDEHEESTHNYPDEVSVLDEIPDRFNDTLEETDFMMKQGLKLLALKKQQQQAQEHRFHTAQHETNQMVKSRTNSGSDDGSRPVLLTPLGKNVKKGTPLGTPHFSYLTPTSGMNSKFNISHGGHSAGFKQNLFSSVGKNSATKNPTNGGAASTGSFKKPVSRLHQIKVPGRFDHIVSPIGAYIKKTPQSMLQTKITCHNKNLIDVLHSENRDSAVSSGSSQGSKENHGINLEGYTSSLPGKGVISSNRAHVLDERNVVRIPGGEKMQKLINSSPTMVIRHEGRIKFAEHASEGERKLMHNMSAMTDDSLADLSVLSSDVSVRVLKDAKRYN